MSQVAHEAQQEEDVEVEDLAPSAAEWAPKEKTFNVEHSSLKAPGSVCASSPNSRVRS